jgi:tRNA pseudouridine55 synthase
VTPARATPNDGVLLYDKPAGVTSHDVVAGVRRSLPRGVKVGHAGTLDPFATGLLLVLIGRATRVQRFLAQLPKTYEVEARFGWVSTTGDVEGTLTRTGVVPRGDLALPTGVVRQRPPAYSAVKVGGRRAYALARAGERVTLPEREVHVHRFDELWRHADRRAYVIECSSGTYVRSLVADLGDAYCVALRRTRIGPFSVSAASQSNVIGLNDALGFLPEVTLSGAEARRAAHGAAVALPASAPAVPARGEGPLAIERHRAGPGAGLQDDVVIRMLDADGLIALASVDRSEGVLRAVVGFRG